MPHCWRSGSNAQRREIGWELLADSQLNGKSHVLWQSRVTLSACNQIDREFTDCAFCWRSEAGRRSGRRLKNKLGRFPGSMPTRHRRHAHNEKALLDSQRERRFNTAFGLKERRPQAFPAGSPKARAVACFASNPAPFACERGLAETLFFAGTYTVTFGSLFSVNSPAPFLCTAPSIISLGAVMTDITCFGSTLNVSTGRRVSALRPIVGLM